MQYHSGRTVSRRFVTTARGALAVMGCAAFVQATGVSAMAQQIVVSPDQPIVLSFAGAEGGPFAPQTSTEWTLENADPDEAQFVVTSDQSWLVVSPASGELGGLLNSKTTVSAQLNAAEAEALQAGVYTAIVSFRNLTNGNGNTERTVHLQVVPASFSVSPAFVNASTNLNGGNPAPQTVTLTNNGGSDLNYDLTWQAQSWFSLSRDSGTVPGGGSSTFTISFNIAGLSAGTFTSEIEIANTTNGAGSRRVPITMTVKSRSASAVTLRPDLDIEVQGPVGSIPTVGQTSTVVNDGEQSVRWSAVLSEPWISVSPSSGELAPNDGHPGGLDEREVTIRINAAVQTLPPGSAAATATFQTITTNLITGEVTGIPFATRVVFVVADPVLSLSVPAVGGTVVTMPEGEVIAASTTSQRLSFPFGQVVVVTATPGDGYEFRGWAGNYPEDAQMINPLILPMDESKSLGALIAPILRTLTLSMTGAGTGTIDMNPTGVEIENPLEAKYTNGTSVDLFAEADAGSVFRGWNGNVPAGEELSNPLTVLMDRARVISARFEPAVEFAVNIQGEGSVTVEPELAAYAVGMTVILTAEADDGFYFSGWGGAAGGSSKNLTLTIAGDTIITAVFAEGDDPNNGGGSGGEDPGDGTTARLMVDVEGDGLVTPNGGNYVKGATVTLIATPTVNSKFVRWEEDASGTELSTTVLMDEDKTIRAIFEATSDTGEPERPTPSGGGSTCGAAGMVGLAGMFLGWVALGFTSRRFMP